jgi:hypothetical protein
MKTANEMQVGGTHYKNSDPNAKSLQHWDLAAECELGYFEGQITKYVTRHRKKNGKQDVLKAIHFATKLKELAQAGKRPQSTCLTLSTVAEFALYNGLTEAERDVLYITINWSTPDMLIYVVHLLSMMVQHVYPDNGATPGAGYVNQDR